MANMFNEDGTYNKTEWKAGDKITAVKLNKIELSLEAINNNDISRHVEVDSRLDILEERDVATNERINELESELMFLEDEFVTGMNGIQTAVNEIDSAIVSAENRLTNIIDNAEDEMSSMVDTVEAEVVNITTRLNKIESNASISVKDFGAKGDGITDDTMAIKNAIDSLRPGSTLYFPSGTYMISDTLQLKTYNVFIKGEYSEVSMFRGIDRPVWYFDNLVNVNIDGLVSKNTTEAQTWIKAISTHHLHITNCYTDGMKLGFDLADCYWTKIESVRMQSIKQAFIFSESTNAFSINNLSVAGAGIPSYVTNCLAGGIIMGSSFEGTSGQLCFKRSTGISITGNYFEGYQHENPTINYIEIGNANYTDCYGYDISGNYFCTGALNAISLYRVSGISITGNTISTTNGVSTYNHDNSKQRDINYSGNHFTGTQEFVVDGTKSTAILGPVYKFPLLLEASEYLDYSLSDGEILLGNEGNKLIIKDSEGGSYYFQRKKTFAFWVDAGSSYEIELDINDGDILDISLYSSGVNGVYGVYKVFKKDSVLGLIRINEDYSTLGNTLTVNDGVLTFKNGDPNWGGNYTVTITY